MKKIILIILLIIIVIIYIKYLKITENISIIQISSEELNKKKLELKEPIVLIDNLEKEKIESVFKKKEIKKKEIKEIWERVEGINIIIYSKKDTEIYICKKNKIKREEPKYNDDIIEIKLKRNRSIIIPYMWYYSIKEKENILIYEVEDIVTKLLKYII